MHMKIKMMQVFSIEEEKSYCHLCYLIISYVFLRVAQDLIEAIQAHVYVINGEESHQNFYLFIINIIYYRVAQVLS